MTNERIGGLIFLALSIFYGVGALAIPSLPIDEFEAMTARTLPFVLSGLGVVLSLALILRNGGDATSFRQGEWPLVGQLIGLSVVYALLLDWLGFIFCTAAFLAGGFVILGERRWPVVAGLPIALVGLLWLLLVVVLDVYLSPGRLFAGAGS